MGTVMKKWLRHGTMAMIVVIVAAMGILIAQRVRHLSTPVGEVDPSAMVGSGDDPVEGIYTDFRYIETVAGQLIFVLNSARTLGKSSGWHEIEDVRLQLFDEGEEGALLSCEGARFNIETRDADLRGPIHVAFPGGAVLTTDSGQFEAGSRRFVTESPVMFTDGDSLGRAGRAMYLLEEDRLVLAGNAVISTGEGMTMRAPTIEYRRGEGRIVFPEGCELVRDDVSIAAPHAVIELADGDGGAKRVVFSGGVTAVSAGLAGGTMGEAWAERIIAERDGSGNWQVAAHTAAKWITVRFRFGDGFYERTLKSMGVRAVVAPEGLLNLRALNGVCLEEVPIAGPPRRAQAENARVWFSDHQPSDMELEGDVILHGEGVEARGHRARFSAKPGVIMLHGDPTGPRRVLLVSDRGRISCDQVQMFDLDRRVEARGSVQGELQGITILGTEPGREQNTPLNIAADVLDISEEGSTFRLRENARLWQGHRLLLADDVLYRQADEVLDATGHVRTTLPATQIDPQASSHDDVVVVARSLHFDRPGQQAIYAGNVRYNDPGHMMSANELNIHFDEHNSITALEATGSVELVDLVTGKRMTGMNARREMTTQIVRITGSPVQLTDENGTVISSSSLTWNQADGSVTVAGGTETIYYPEDEP